MRKSADKPLAIGALIAFAVWIFIVLPLLYGPRDNSAANKCSAKESGNYSFWEKAACDPVAYFTLLLVGVTGVLACSTIGLWIVTWRGTGIQARDTRILQRAYLHVAPRGIEVSPQGAVTGQVAICNAGHLPARKVSSDARIMWSDDRSVSDFEEAKVPIRHTNVLPAGGEMLRGTGPLNGGRTVLATQEGFIYVWGRVTYEDGFDEPRWLTFCHRYNCGSPQLREGGMAAKYARHHHHYNDGN
jgi:hypothetical protein